MDRFNRYKRTPKTSPTKASQTPQCTNHLDSRPLIQPLEKLSTRQQTILAAIQQHPGIYVRRLAMMLRTTTSSLNYHLNTLIRRGFIHDRRIGRRKHLFPVQNEDHSILQAMSWDDTFVKVLDALRQWKGVPPTPNLLATKIGCDDDTVRRHLEILESEKWIGLDKGPDGTRIIWSAAPKKVVGLT